MARKKITQYKSYTENNQRYMICRNSIENGKYWKGKLCGEWVKVGPSVTAVLCHKCVNKVVDPPKSLS